VDEGPGLRTRDPARLAGPGRDASIQRRRELERDEGPAAFDHREEATVLLPTALLENPGRNPEARSAQLADSAARHLRVRIPMPHDHVPNTGLEDRSGAGTGSPRVAARLEGDGQRRPAQGTRAVTTARRIEGHDLCMIASRRLGAAPPEDPTAAIDDSAHWRVRKDAPARRTRLAKRRAHGRLGRHSGSVSPIAAKKAA
jgi:hypothetical protein